MNIRLGAAEVNVTNLLNRVNILETKQDYIAGTAMVGVGDIGGNNTVTTNLTV
jgi:hypothetical protein